MHILVSRLRYETAWISAPSGPGQVERITILSNDSNIATFTDNTIWLYIDDLEVFAGPVQIIGGVREYDHVDGPYSGIHAGVSGIDFAISEVYDYETSFALGLQNMTSQEPLTVRMLLKGRVGR